MKFLTEDNRKKITDCLFYLALTIELVLMIVEKSELHFSIESYVFRVTFLLTLCAMLVMKHDWREWVVIFIILAIAGYAYIHSGKNDLLRLSVFLMAARDIDLTKAMKYSFYVSIVGFLLIVILSVTGVLGNMALVADYGRDVGSEKRYVLGFGHPNTLFGCGYAVLLMWLWIYGKTCRWWGYVIASALSGALIMLTRSRTGALICALTLFLAVISRIFKGVAEKKWPYILGTIFAPVLSIGLTIAGAYLAVLLYSREYMDPLFWMFEEKINYRISNLYYSTENRDGILTKWKLFAGHGSDSYFDMGWARLFYWYGIIPTVIIVIALFVVIYVCWKKHDVWTMILIISLSLYTVVEATFVTRYLGRDFFLLIAGVYLGYFFRSVLFKIDLEGDTNV